MLPVYSGGHSAYQDFVVTNLRKYYPNPDAIARSTWDIIDRFWNLDLSFTDDFMRGKYSIFGPKPRTPSCMQRSYLLSIDFKVTSLTDWAAQLKINPLYAILSGFEFGDTPGVGTFYDFLARLWDSKDIHLSSHIHSLKSSVKKPKTKGTKADSIEKITVEQLLPELEQTVFNIDELPYGSLFKIYQRDCFYHGYDLYMLVASDSESDLPVFPFLSPASKHDSHGFLHTFFRMKSCLPDMKVSKLLLDSAHDAMPYYQYCKREGITPFIDLNAKRGIKLPYKDDFTIGKDGVPVCKEGRRMNHDGTEPSKYRIKFRCPLASRKYGCSCEHPCSSSKYGKTVHLAMKDNPRLINIPPRDSDEWKTEYNARTSAERSNKRILKFSNYIFYRIFKKHIIHASITSFDVIYYIMGSILYRKAL